MKVEWTVQALLRLAEIQEYVAADSREAADRLLGRLVARGEQLARSPRSGRPLPELSGGELREVLEGNYRLVYRVRGKRVEVITVFEGHQLLPREDLPAASPSE